MQDIHRQLDIDHLIPVVAKIPDGHISGIRPNIFRYHQLKRPSTARKDQMYSLCPYPETYRATEGPKLTKVTRPVTHRPAASGGHPYRQMGRLSACADVYVDSDGPFHWAGMQNVKKTLRRKILNQSFLVTRHRRNFTFGVLVVQRREISPIQLRKGKTPQLNQEKVGIPDVIFRWVSFLPGVRW